MKKIKSIKFHNFDPIEGANHTSINVNFYDIDNNLVPIDTTDCFTNTATLCENSKYIFTSNGAYSNVSSHMARCAFNTGNLNVNYTKDGSTWVAPSFIASPNDYVKIEFKTPAEFSKMKIINSYHSVCGFNKCGYLIEYEDGETKDFIFNSDRKLNIYSSKVIENKTFDQTTVDSMFKDAKLYYDNKVFDTNIAMITTNDSSCFKNVSNNIRNINCVYEKPNDTYIKFAISFDNRNSWKVFGDNWSTLASVDADSIFNNGMDISLLNQLTKNNLISGGFCGSIDFKIILKTDNNLISPSISSIKIIYY